MTALEMEHRTPMPILKLFISRFSIALLLQITFLILPFRMISVKGIIEVNVANGIGVIHLVQFVRQSIEIFASNEKTNPPAPRSKRKAELQESNRVESIIGCQVGYIGDEVVDTATSDGGSLISGFLAKWTVRPLTQFFRRFSFRRRLVSNQADEGVLGIIGYFDAGSRT